jgi:hypothetical protein
MPGRGPLPIRRWGAMDGTDTFGFRKGNQIDGDHSIVIGTDTGHVWVEFVPTWKIGGTFPSFLEI